MTVRYLRSVRNQNMTGKQNGESLIVEYQRVIVLLHLYNTKDSLGEYS